MTTNDSNITNIYARLEARAKAAKEAPKEAPEQAQKPRQLWLPGFDLGAFPNHLNRSSLFAPIARGKRKLHRYTEMVSRSDCKIYYGGEQLDEADADLMMALIWYAARSHAVGDLVPISQHELLKLMGRKASGQHYEWLHRRMWALTNATLCVETKRYRIGKKEDGENEGKPILTNRRGASMAFHMVERWFFTGDPLEDDDSPLYNGLNPDTYYYQLNPDWVTMFSNHEFSLPDWSKRMAIGRGQDLAKALQRTLAASSDSVQRFALDDLKEQMQYTSPMRKFRDALNSATNELKRVGVISKAKIETSTKGKEQLIIEK